MTDAASGLATLGFSPRVEVPPPPRYPFKYGLFSVAPPGPFGSPHEKNGVWANLDPYTPPDGSAGGPDAFTYSDGCDAASDRTKVVPPGTIDAFGDPVTVYGGFACTPLGNTDEERHQAAEAALGLGAERALEILLAGGVTSNGVTWPVPLDSSHTIDATSHVKLAETFGGLEQTIALDYGAEGTIMVPGSLWDYLGGFGMLKFGDDGVRTPMGNRVCVCRGLTATALDSSVPVLVGGSLVLRRGEVLSLGNLAQSLDRSKNDLVYTLEQTYLLLNDYPPAD